MTTKLKRVTTRVLNAVLALQRFAICRELDLSDSREDAALNRALAQDKVVAYETRQLARLQLDLENIRDTEGDIRSKLNRELHNLPEKYA